MCVHTFILLLLFTFIATIHTIYYIYMSYIVKLTPVESEDALVFPCVDVSLHLADSTGSAPYVRTVVFVQGPLDTGSGLEK